LTGEKKEEKKGKTTISKASLMIVEYVVSQDGERKKQKSGLGRIAQL
jgi:hypothetical protein